MKTLCPHCKKEVYDYRLDEVDAGFRVTPTVDTLRSVEFARDFSVTNKERVRLAQVQSDLRKAREDCDTLCGLRRDQAPAYEAQLAQVEDILLAQANSILDD